LEPDERDSVKKKSKKKGFINSYFPHFKADFFIVDFILKKNNDFLLKVGAVFFLFL
jgi:hypothetical protein